MSIVTILETLMLVFWAVSWPASLYKTIKSRTAKGKSLIFLICVLLGYLLGISKVICAEGLTGFLLIPYCFNFLLIFVDFMFHLRNMRLDKMRELEATIPSSQESL